MKSKYCFPKQEFFNDLSAYREQLSSPELSADAKPSEFIGNSLIDLAENLSTKQNFRGYPTFVKEEMVSHAMEKCVKGLTKFDLSRPEKVFSYFCKVSWFSFLDVIGAYYKQLNIKRQLTRSFLEKYDYSEDEIQAFTGEDKIGGTIPKGYAQQTEAMRTHKKKNV